MSLQLEIESCFSADSTTEEAAYEWLSGVLCNIMYIEV